ncbi:MAG: hypothetical protein HONBIEJF_02364 [Fimbriimonadaceae bacterium]|nr:hypothetical protein [Fimbriimonadaceae bacterium]
MWRVLRAAVAIGASAWMLSGCGGSGGASTQTETSDIVIEIQWPEQSRLIPEASQSIRVSAIGNGSLRSETVVPRPSGGEGTTTTNLTNLPAGPVRVTATAHPTADGTGVTQAGAETLVTLASGEKRSVALTLASTIERLEVQPKTVLLDLGASKTLVMTALSRDNEIVLLSSNKIQWSIVGPGIVTLSAAGGSAIVTAKEPGSTSIRVLETESGVSVTANVVAGGGDITIDPPGWTMGSGSTKSFKATAKTGEQSFTWEVVEGSGTLVDKSSNPVSFRSGPVEGTAILRATQTATGKTGTALIQVVNKAVVINGAPFVLNPGESRTVSATVLGSGDQRVTWTGSGVTFSQADGNPTTITAGSQTGSYSIRATSVAHGMIDDAPVTITGGNETVVVIDPATASIRKLETFKFKAVVTGLSDTSVTWRIEPTAGASIDASGKFIATNQIGEWRVMAKAKDGTECAVPSKIYVTAEPHDLSVESSPGGVAIQVSRADVQGEKDGTTWFKRRYTYLEPVTLTAPYKISNGKTYFDRWILVDEQGRVEKTSTAIVVPMAGNTTATANYVPACEVTVKCINTDGNAINDPRITVDKADLDGLTQCTGFGTFYYRIFNSNPQTVRFTAQASVGGRAFKEWKVDDQFKGTGLNLDLKIDSSAKFVTAVYQ